MPQRMPRSSPVVPAVAGAGAVVAATVAVAAAAAIAVGPPWLHEDRADTMVATAPAPVERVLLEAPGWRLESIGGGAGRTGSATYRADGPTLEISRYPADQWASRSDNADLGAPRRTVVLGRMTRVWASTPTDHVAIRPPEGATFVQVRGQGLDARAFDAVLSQLVPAATVLPEPTGESAADRDDLIARWGEGLVLPSAVDHLDPHLPGLTTRQSTAVTVLRGFACGWVSDHAATAGDDQARDVVLDGLAGLTTSAASVAAQATTAPGEVEELLAGVRSGAGPAVLTARCQVIQGG